MRRQYTEEQKAEAVASIATLGVSGAARKHGVHQTNVSRWLKAARAAAANGVPAEPAPEITPQRGAVAATAPGPEAVRAPASGPKSKRAATVSVKSTKTVPVKSTEAVSTTTTSNGTTSISPPARRVAKVYTPSQKAEMLEYASRHGITDAADHFAVSRFSIYDWRSKVKKAAAGDGASPTSGPAPADIEAQRDREILDEWHHHPGLGPSQIRNQLRRRKIKVSVHTVRRVMEDAGYRPPKVVRQAHDDRYEAVRPNHMWHADFVHRYINHASTFTLILIDDYSRYVVGYGVDDAERADLVIATFEEAVQRHGKPEILMNDGGSAFWSWRGISRFTSLLTEMGVDQIPAKNKELNGKNEVFNANLEKEFFDVHRFHDVTAMRRGLGGHLHWYNHGRTHHALGGLLVPADRYYGRADEVLARIEAGGGREKSLDTLDLRDRSLDLSPARHRVPEVWLFGKRLY
jgi:transposase InsO family protein